MAKSKVAILRTNPEKVLDDTIRLFELADGPKHLDPGTTTILKDNISWHHPFPSANTTPWQLEGTILALQQNNFRDISCVQNKTEVTDAYKGEDLNNYKPIFKAYNLEVLFNFKDDDMKWVNYRPQSKMLALEKIYGDNIRIPDYFINLGSVIRIRTFQIKTIQFRGLYYDIVIIIHSFCNGLILLIMGKGSDQCFMLDTCNL